ncbi:hypothetical protein BLNAU_20115 [Blattamonas nauphoetae]|uniref:Uncharacterized protein n=1 Tax=Blattamonas nauphoetae TaxID=2049346 RepID=A0ABQ9WZK7_9EUKA|nr:hypothetical protein BLNAU_20115 [Blattamonas nauphoetae]
MQRKAEKQNMDVLSCGLESWLCVLIRSGHHRLLDCGRRGGRGPDGHNDTLRPSRSSRIAVRTLWRSAPSGLADLELADRSNNSEWIRDCSIEFLPARFATFDSFCQHSTPLISDQSPKRHHSGTLTSVCLMASFEISSTPHSSCALHPSPPPPLTTSSLLVCSVGTAFSLSSNTVDSFISCSICLIIARSPTMLLKGVERWNFALVSSIADRAHLMFPLTRPDVVPILFRQSLRRVIRCSRCALTVRSFTAPLCHNRELPLVVFGRVVDCGCAEGMMDARTKRQHRRSAVGEWSRTSARLRRKATIVLHTSSPKCNQNMIVRTSTTHHSSSISSSFVSDGVVSLLVVSPPTPSHSPLPLPHPHTLPLPSASPSPPTPSHSPLPLPHHPHRPTPLCLSLTTHTLPLPSASPSPPIPSHSPLTLPHHPHPPTLLCLSLTTHTLPLPLPLPHHPHPPTPSASPSPLTPSHSLCLSLTTHTLPLPLPLPHHPHPPTPSASPSPPTPPTPSASPSPPTPSHSLSLSLTTHTLPLPLPLPHHPHPHTPL